MTARELWSIIEGVTIQEVYGSEPGLFLRGVTREQLSEVFVRAQLDIFNYEHEEREVSNPYHKELSDDRPR